MKRFLLIIVVIVSSVSFINAQDYNTGIGLRGGLSNGLSVKHFIGESTAIEGIFTSRWKGYDITGLYEIHQNLLETDRLNWYYGFGGHIGFWNGDNVSWVNDDSDYMVIGIDGILGVEYNLTDYPINVSIDWKPAINLIGYTSFWGDGGAISIRYIF